MMLDYCERCDPNFRSAIGALEAFLVCGNNDVVVKQANELLSFLKNPSVSTTGRFFPLAPGNSTDSRHDTFNQLADENRHFYFAFVSRLQLFSNISCFALTLHVVVLKH